MDASSSKKMAGKLKNPAIKILMGIAPTKDGWGGPQLHLQYLVDYFNGNPNFQITTFDYGSRDIGNDGQAIGIRYTKEIRQP